MKRQTPDPLTTEERALADRLARLGPHDGPSPALDAKILAAAHAAAAGSRPQQRSRRRWSLSAIPGGLITGVGVAATMALAVGVVWQLRPMEPSVQAPSHEAADSAYTSAEMIERPRQTIAPPPPPPPALPQARMSKRELSLRDAAPAPAAPPPLPAAASASAAKIAEEPAQADAYGYLESDAPSPAAPGVRRQRTDKNAAAAAASAPADAAASMAGIADTSRAAPRYAPPMPAAAPPAPAPAAGADSDGFSLASSKARRAAEAAEDRREAEAKQSTTLDRIEVTGSRVKRTDVESAQPVATQSMVTMQRNAIALPPVAEDTRLDRADWLQRIRARRDAGRLDEARASLVLFRKSHPRVRIPDDLRALQR